MGSSSRSSFIIMRIGRGPCSSSGYSRIEAYHSTELPAAILLVLSFRETKGMVLSEVEAAIDRLKEGISS